MANYRIVQRTAYNDFFIEKKGLIFWYKCEYQKYLPYTKTFIREVFFDSFEEAKKQLDNWISRDERIKEIDERSKQRKKTNKNKIIWPEE